MNWRGLSGISTATVLGLALLAGSAAGQQKSLKEQLQGTWTAVAATTTDPDGKKSEQYGPNPKGMVIFDGNSRLSFILVASSLPKFASNNRATGTAGENAAVVQGSIAYFGTYTVDEADKSYTTQVEAATFPNWAGVTQKRKVTISGDELTIGNPAASAGGVIETKWKRVPARTKD
jgi:hypothetical protein